MKLSGLFKERSKKRIARREAEEKERQERAWHAEKQARFKQLYFAEVPVDFDVVTEIRNEVLPKSGPVCWVDAPDALLEVDRKLGRGEISAAEAEICVQFITEGYCIAKSLIPTSELDSAWAAYEAAIASNAIELKLEPHGENDPFPGRTLDPHVKVPEIRALQWHPAILRITNVLFGRETVPFQTIMGHKSSAQAPHSDAIHMTTYPLGFLIATWTAFEDIHPESGPLEYFPKSHRLLPYLLSREVGIEPLQFKEQGYSTYHDKYEPAIRRHLEAYGIRPSYFEARKGDVLFWHSNLVHGGQPRKDFKWSRKALVAHYFAKGAVTYHDLSGNPSRLHRDGMYEPLRVD